MKKLLLSLSLCALLCGCSEKVAENKEVKEEKNNEEIVTCVFEEEYYTEKVTITKNKDNEVVKMQKEETYKDKEEAEMACIGWKEELEEENAPDSVQIKCSDKTFTLSIDKKEDLEKEGFVNFYEVITQFVNDGYKCD